MKIINRIITVQLSLCIVFICNSQEVKTGVSDEQLRAMNNAPMSPYIEASNHKKGEEFKILILGNSLAHHGIAPDIGWDHAAGMAASEIEKDYAHLLLQMTDSIMPDKNIRMRIAGMAVFERNLTTFDFSVLDNLVSFHPDLIIVQIGENVSFDGTQTPDLFREKYISLIRYLQRDRHPTIICTTSFFPSATKSAVTRQVALTTKSFLVDLSHLALSDEQNYAKNETGYPGDRDRWKVDGIGVHPGDFGMKNIAREIFTVINAIYTGNHTQ